MMCACNVTTNVKAPAHSSPPAPIPLLAPIPPPSATTVETVAVQPASKPSPIDALIQALASPSYCASSRKIAAVMVSLEDIKQRDPSFQSVPLWGKEHSDLDIEVASSAIEHHGLEIPDGFDGCTHRETSFDRSAAENRASHSYTCRSRASIPTSEQARVLSVAMQEWKKCFPSSWKIYEQDPHQRTGISFLKKSVKNGNRGAHEGCRMWIDDTLRIECSRERWVGR